MIVVDHEDCQKQRERALLVQGRNKEIFLWMVKFKKLRRRRKILPKKKTCARMFFFSHVFFFVGGKKFFQKKIFCERHFLVILGG